SVLLRTGKVLINGGRSADGAALASAELYDPATGTWTLTGSMATARRHHTATLMQHGTVMVVGGSADDDGTVSFDTTEIYNPATGAWTDAGLITQARSFHTATAIEGAVYVVGGISDGVYNTVLEYHQLYFEQTHNGRWEVSGIGPGSSDRARKFHTATPMPNHELLVTGGVRNVTLATARLMVGYNQPVPGSLSIARSEHTATMLPDGRVLAAGGLSSEGAAIAEAETYTKASGKWTATGGMKAARAGHTATLLPGGRVLFAGGYSADGALSSCELYTAAATPWAETAPLNLGRERPSSTLLPDGAVLVAGGANRYYAAVGDAQLYNPVSDIWTSVPGFSPRASHSAVLLPDGRVMVAGGFTDWDGLVMTNTTILFDPVSRSWTPSGNLLAKRSSHAAVLLPDGKVLLAGGYFRTTYEDGAGLASVEIYDPVTGVCRAAAPMSMARTGPRATLLADGRVLVLGGNNESDSTASRSAEIYDPAANAWSAAGTLLFPHGSGTATLLSDGKVLLAGGLDYNDKNAKGVAEIYDPAANIWRQAAPMLTEGLSHSAGLLHDGKVLVTGSYHYENAGSPGGNAEIYDPVTDSWSLAGSCRSVYHGTSMLLDGKVL
ncbi:MAG: hypothetical protein EOP86_23075, partial [Verrucomicrobiaceae bacterium]